MVPLTIRAPGDLSPANDRERTNQRYASADGSFEEERETAGGRRCERSGLWPPPVPCWRSRPVAGFQRSQYQAAGGLQPSHQPTTSATLGHRQPLRAGRGVLGREVAGRSRSRTATITRRDRDRLLGDGGRSASRRRARVRHIHRKDPDSYLHKAAMVPSRLRRVEVEVRGEPATRLEPLTSTRSSLG